MRMRRFAALLLSFTFFPFTALGQTPAGAESDGSGFKFGVEILPVLQVQPGPLQYTTGFSGNRIGEFTPITKRSGVIFASNLFVSGYIGENKWRFGGGVNLTTPVSRELTASPMPRFLMERKVKASPLVQLEHQTRSDLAVFGGYTDTRYTVVNPLGRRIPIKIYQPHIGVKYRVGRVQIAVFGGPAWGKKSPVEDRISVNNKGVGSIGVSYRLGK